MNFKNQSLKGQSVVIYDGDIVVAGGIIDEVK